MTNVIDLKGTPMQPEEESQVMVVLRNAEEAFRNLKEYSIRNQLEIQNTRVVHEGLTWGVSAYLRLIQRHMGFVSMVAKGESHG